MRQRGRRLARARAVRSAARRGIRARASPVDSAWLRGVARVLLGGRGALLLLALAPDGFAEALARLVRLEARVVQGGIEGAKG